MLLDFEINKAVAASAYLISREGGEQGMFVLIKKLYYADRLALIKWGRSITGDSFASLAKGPIVSRIYDLLKGKGAENDLIEWNDVILRKGNKITLRKRAYTGALSQRELEALDEAAETINGIKGSIADWLHKNCPEWQDPHGSSKPIDPSQILRVAKKSEEHIRRVEEDNEEIRFMNYLLGTR
ncbi:MAG: DUF4065 domain-containing protein [Acidobacteria bacterium]|nr:MAG: DUF4065 domain-containing protein [Acidobacteriota bacterium]